MAISERLFVPRVSLFSRFINHLLKISFHLLYHQLAWAYDWIAALVSCGLWNTWVVQALPYLEGPLVLELGPGPGHMQAALRRMGVHVYGVEASWHMAKRFGNFRDDVGFVNIDVVNGYAQFICFPNSSFDQVVATFPSEYIFDRQTISEINRVLKPGGRLVVVLSAALSGPSICHRLMRRLYFSPSLTEPVVSPWLDSLRQVGFSATQVTVQLPTSQVFLLIAESHSPIDSELM